MIVRRSQERVRTNEELKLDIILRLCYTDYMNTKSIKLKRLWRAGHYAHIRAKLKQGFFKGRKHTLATKKKMRRAKLGKKRVFTTLHRKHLSKALKGIKRSFDGVDKKQKHYSRSMFNCYLGRGKIKKKPCEICGSKRSEAHHYNYNLPFAVRWLCKKHHWQEEIKKKNVI